IGLIYCQSSLGRIHIFQTQFLCNRECRHCCRISSAHAFHCHLHICWTRQIVVFFLFHQNTSGICVTGSSQLREQHISVRLQDDSSPVLMEMPCHGISLRSYQQLYFSSPVCRQSSLRKYHRRLIRSCVGLKIDLI